MYVIVVRIFIVIQIILVTRIVIIITIIIIIICHDLLPKSTRGSHVKSIATLVIYQIKAALII